MKIYRKIEWEWVDNQLVQTFEDSFEYEGELLLAEEVAEEIYEETVGVVVETVVEGVQDNIVDPVVEGVSDGIEIIKNNVTLPFDYLFGGGGYDQNDVVTGNVFDNPFGSPDTGGPGDYSIPPGLRTSPFEPTTYGVPIIYGTRKTKGQIVLRETSTDNKVLFLYFALCEGELASKPTIVSTPDTVLSAGADYVTTDATVGSDSGMVADVDPSKVAKFRSNPQAPPSWTDAHLAKGVSMAYTRFVYDETEMNRYPRLHFIVTGRAITGNDDNPINQLKDYMTNTRFGAGIDSSLIDTTSFNSARDYCDETDSAGVKRFTSNIILDSRQTVLTNIRKITQTCGAQIHFRNGKYFAHIDQAFGSGTPVFDFTIDNIIGAIRVSKLGKTNRFNKCIITWTNPDDEYQSSEIVWPDVNESGEATIYNTYLSEDNNKVLEKRIGQPAVTNAQQARYIAQMVVRQSRLGTVVKLTATKESADVVPGDIVTLTHSSFSFSSKKFRVRTVKILKGVGIDFTLTEHDDAVYSRDVFATPSVAGRTTTRDSSVVAQPGSLTGTEVIYTSRDGAGVKNKVVLNWNDIDDNFLSAYEVSYKLGSASNYQAWAETQETTIEVTDLGPGTFDFRVVARNIEGTKSSASVVTVVCTGLPTPPAQMTGLTINSLGPTVALARWNLSESTDVQQAGFYRIAHSVDQTVTNWDNGVVITQQIAGSQTSAIVPLLAGTYLIRATDSSGQKSLADTFVHDGTSLQELTNLQTLTEDPTFSGNKTKLVVTDDYLKIVSADNIDEISDFDAIDDMDSLNGVYARSGGNWPSDTPLYEFSQYLDLGSVQNVRLASYIKFFTTNYQDKIDSWGNIDDRIDFDGVNEGLTDIDIEFAQTDDDPNASPTWGEWNDFYVAETKARGFKFRVFPITDDSSHNVVIQNLRVFAQQLST